MRRFDFNLVFLKKAFCKECRCSLREHERVFCPIVAVFVTAGVNTINVGCALPTSVSSRCVPEPCFKTASFP